MMLVLGVVLEILDDSLQNFVVRPIAVIKHVQFAIKNTKQLFDVAMLFEQDFDHS